MESSFKTDSDRNDNVKDRESKAEKRWVIFNEQAVSPRFRNLDFSDKQLVRNVRPCRAPPSTIASISFFESLVPPLPQPSSQPAESAHHEAVLPPQPSSLPAESPTCVLVLYNASGNPLGHCVAFMQVLMTGKSSPEWIYYDSLRCNQASSAMSEPFAAENFPFPGANSVTASTRSLFLFNAPLVWNQNRQTVVRGALQRLRNFVCRAASLYGIADVIY